MTKRTQAEMMAREMMLEEQARREYEEASAANHVRESYHRKAHFRSPDDVARLNASRRAMRRGAARRIVRDNGGQVVSVYSSRGLDFSAALHVAADLGLRVVQDRAELVFYAL